jgi:HSP20 family protein
VSYHRRERRYGKFSRTIQLPRDLDPEKVRAELRNGLLTIRIPKLASAKPRQIEVQAA